MTEEDLGIDDLDTEVKTSDRLLLSTLLPIDQITLNETLNISLDRDARIPQIVVAMLNDPILALEVIGHANKAYGFDKAGISSIQNSIIRIGSENLITLLRELKSRPVITDQEVASEFEKLRLFSINAYKVAGILSANLRRDLLETSQSCAFFSYIGQMICCYCLGNKYLEFSQIKKKSSLVYRIKSTYNIDLFKIHIQFLKDRCLPPLMFFAFDRELKCKTTAQSSLRFITDATLEILEAVEEGKWDKYLSPSKFPTKSNLRLLKITDSIYSKIRHEIEEVLDIAKKKKQEYINSNNPDSTLILDRENIASGFNMHETLVLDRETIIKQPEIEEKEKEERKPLDLNIKDIETQNGTIKGYKINDLSVDAQALIGLMGYICEEATSVSNMITDIMQILTDQGPFYRAALIEMIEPEKWGEVHTAVGEDFELLPKRAKIDITDPMSPLLTLATKISSFNYSDQTDEISPFGISSYAISTLELEADKRLILYADCGLSRPVPLEARKMFRLAVNLLNKSLPYVIQKSIQRQSKNISNPAN